MLFCVSDIAFARDIFSNEPPSAMDEVKGAAKIIAFNIAGALVTFGTMVLATNVLNSISAYQKFSLVENVKERFSDVAGNYEAKANLEELVDFLKNPKKYSHLGTKIPKGMLMYGPPGTGKTLLARALAGEANCSFIPVNGSDFTDKFVGVAEGYIRSLFAKARRNGPCIIFIDEIDAVGKKRGSTNSSSYQDNILNQLLVEMDGFKQSDKPVIVIAATNRKDVLDSALLRSGRFDRDVYVGAPDLQARKEILQVHLKKVKAEGDIDIDRIAKGTPGFVGADLANLVNEAAFIAVKNNNGVISMNDFEYALDKISIGVPTSIELSRRELEVTAYHEAGHALVALLNKDFRDVLHKVSIEPRGATLGVTYTLPSQEYHQDFKDSLLAQIAVLLGGRAAEEVFLNTSSDGCVSDFQKATNVAFHMIARFGMSDEFGKITYDIDYLKSDAHAQEVAKKIVAQQYDLVKQLLIENKDKIEIMV